MRRLGKRIFAVFENNDNLVYHDLAKTDLHKTKLRLAWPQQTLPLTSKTWPDINPVLI